MHTNEYLIVWEEHLDRSRCESHATEEVLHHEEEKDREEQGGVKPRPYLRSSGAHGWGMGMPRDPSHLT